MTTTMTRADLHRLARVAAGLERELNDLRLAGLEARAADVAAELGQVRDRIQKAQRAREVESLQELQQKNIQKQAHERAQQAEKEAAGRRREADAWLRSWQTYQGGHPQPVTDVYRSARVGGIAPEDVAAVGVYVRRRSDGVKCLGVPESYRRRDFLPD